MNNIYRSKNYKLNHLKKQRIIAKAIELIARDISRSTINTMLCELFMINYQTANKYSGRAYQLFDYAFMLQVTNCMREAINKDCYLKERVSQIDQLRTLSYYVHELPVLPM